jgi:hypothetical protein
MARLLLVSALWSAFVVQSPAQTATPATSPFAAAVVKRPGLGEPVALTFAWPVGLTATIEAEGTKTTTTPAGTNVQRGGLRYRMRVSAHPEGRLISYDNFEAMEGSASLPGEAGIDQLLQTLMPSIVITKTGQFVRIGDVAAIRATLKHVFDEMKKQAPGGNLPPQIQALIDNLMSEKTLTQVAAAEWYAFAGAYVGYSGTIGTMTDVDSEEPLPILPGVMVPMRTTFGARQRGPCLPRAAGEDCIVMSTRSVVAPGVMEGILAKLIEGMKGLENIRYNAIDVVTEVHATVDPATLRPFQVTRTKNVDVRMSAPGMGRASALVVEKKSYRITYQ